MVFWAFKYCNIPWNIPGMLLGGYKWHRQRQLASWHAQKLQPCSSLSSSSWAGRSGCAAACRSLKRSGSPPEPVERAVVAPLGPEKLRCWAQTKATFPNDGFLNDNIDGSLCSMMYTTFDEAVVQIGAFRPGALLAKTTSFQLPRFLF